MEIYFILGGKSNHSLTKKLLKKKFNNPIEVFTFYKEKCGVKLIHTNDKLEARILEPIFIWLLNPQYNDECSKNKI